MKGGGTLLFVFVFVFVFVCGGFTGTKRKEKEGTEGLKVHLCLHGKSKFSELLPDTSAVA